MQVYEDWRISLRLLSPLGTPMQSDTVFGHLVWQVALNQGQDAVKEFLAPFLAGEPLFILSDAFPAGLLPRPLFPRTMAVAASRAEYAQRKFAEKAPYVRVDDFSRLLRNPEADVEPVASPWIAVKTPHAAIDRRSDTTGGGDDAQGRLFHTESMILAGENLLDLYVRSLPGWRNRIVELFEQVCVAGFGRDKSVGSGCIEVESVHDCSFFASFPQASGFVSLSSMVPAADDPTDGRWQLRVKRGFLGEHGGGGNPFKRPLVQMEPGAVFRVSSGKVKRFYGRVVSNIAPGMPEAVQNCLALAVPCSWGCS